MEIREIIGIVVFAFVFHGLFTYWDCRLLKTIICNYNRDDELGIDIDTDFLSIMVLIPIINIFISFVLACVLIRLSVRDYLKKP